MAEARRPRILSIVGTRPEAIKMRPVAEALAARGRFSHHLLLTGQHQGLAAAFADLLVPHELPVDPTARNPARLRERLDRLLGPRLRALAPDLILVHGDTSSALAGAMAARAVGVAIGHVEAGLRSFDMRQPWPEEGNRIAIDALSDLLFAPTANAAANLAMEWRARGEIHVTGNTGIDAILREVERIRQRGGREVRARPLLLATCHRKENLGAPTESVCRALRRIARTLPVDIAFILHPNPLVRAPIERLLASEPNISLLDPLDYGPMVRLLDSATVVLTDSGGLQEEGPALGKPVLVLRERTERPEALESENILLVGTDTDRILATVESLLADPARLARMSRPSFPFGDGRAAPRIVAAIEHWLDRRRGQPLMLWPGAAAPATAPARRALPTAVR